VVAIVVSNTVEVANEVLNVVPYVVAIEVVVRKSVALVVTTAVSQAVMVPYAVCVTRDVAVAKFVEPVVITLVEKFVSYEVTKAVVVAKFVDFVVVVKKFVAKVLCVLNTVRVFCEVFLLVPIVVSNVVVVAYAVLNVVTNNVS